MAISNLDVLIQQVKTLSPTERLRLIEYVAVTLQSDLVDEEDWHSKLQATYGILADEPVERLPQPPLEERDMLE